MKTKRDKCGSCNNVFDSTQQDYQSYGNKNMFVF